MSKPSTHPEVNLAKLTGRAQGKTSTSRILGSCQGRQTPSSHTRSRSPLSFPRPSQTARLRWRRRRQRWSSGKGGRVGSGSQSSRRGSGGGKQKADNSSWKLTGHRQTTRRSCHALSRPQILSHTFLREVFQALSGGSKPSPLLSQLELACKGLSSMLAAATPIPRATDARKPTRAHWSDQKFVEFVEE